MRAANWRVITNGEIEVFGKIARQAHWHEITISSDCLLGLENMMRMCRECDHKIRRCTVSKKGELLITSRKHVDRLMQSRKCDIPG